MSLSNRANSLDCLEFHTEYIAIGTSLIVLACCIQYHWHFLQRGGWGAKQLCSTANRL